MKGKIGFGTAVAVGNGASPEIFTPLKGFKDISVSGFDIPSVDITHLASASREEQPGLANVGTVSGTLVLDSSETTQQDLIDDFTDTARPVKNYKITLADVGGLIITVPCYVQNFEPNASTEDTITASVTLKATAAPTFA
jgi:hypothetical protein